MLAWNEDQADEEDETPGAGEPGYDPKSRPRVLDSGTGLPKGKPRSASGPDESMRWRLTGSSMDDIDDAASEKDAEEKEDRGLISGVRSERLRREGALKLKFMLKISLGRRFLRMVDAHPVGFVGMLIFNIDFVLAGDESDDATVVVCETGRAIGGDGISRISAVVVVCRGDGLSCLGFGLTAGSCCCCGRCC